MPTESYQSKPLNQAAKGIENNQYKVIEAAPHGLNITHAEELNKTLISFLKNGTSTRL